METGSEATLLPPERGWRLRAVEGPPDRDTTAVPRGRDLEDQGFVRGEAEAIERIAPTGDKLLADIYAHVIAFMVLALPWGLLALLVLPHATATFAASGNPGDLFDLAAAVRGVRRDFATWNLAAAAIVTGWAIGLACAGLLCVGIVPGIFYAILVSAHAAAALHRPDPRPTAG